MSKLNTFAVEIDEYTGVRLRYLSKDIQDKVLAGKCTRCEQKLKKDSPPILYVECFGGKLVWWHNRINIHENSCDN